MVINKRFTISYVFYDGGNMEIKIALIGTGGTIAGKGASGTDLTGYTAGPYQAQNHMVHIHILSLVILKAPILLSGIGWIYLS